MKRRVPSDDVLTRIFKEHAGELTRVILDRYGWDISVNTLRGHRRRLGRVSPIAGVASMSDAEFREAMTLTLLDRLVPGRLQ